MKRYGFVDWYRGLACVLMFQTHAYDSWTAEASRHGWFFDASRHLGGFPARLFLLLAGVALMLRFDSDRRRGVDPWVSRKGAARRGLEVLALGYLFHFTEWVLGIPSLRLFDNILRVDILNCIGLSLVLSAYIAGPDDLAPRRVPVLPAAAALLIVFATPWLERARFPAWAPLCLTSYLAGRQPMAFFPLFPWMAYTLTGCVAGAYWIRAIREGRGGRAMLVTAAIGLVMAAGGQIANRSSIALYHFGDAMVASANVLTSPVSYFYRGGVCVVGAALAYGICLLIPAERFSPLRQLGQTSLLVYWVHVEMVYGHLSDPIKRRLGLVWASVFLVMLTGLMVWLSWWRTHRHDRYGKRGILSTARS